MGLLIQTKGLHRVSFHPVAVLIALPQQGLGPGIALLRRQGEQAGGLFIVLFHGDTVVIEKAQPTLSGGKPLFRRRAVEFQGLVLVLGHPPAHLIAQPQLAHGGDILLLRRRHVQFSGPVKVLAGAHASGPAQTGPILGGDMSPLGGLVQPIEGLPVVLLRPAAALVITYAQAILRLQIAALRRALEFLQPRPLFGRHCGHAVDHVGVDVHHHPVLLRPVPGHALLVHSIPLLSLLKKSLQAAFLLTATKYDLISRIRLPVTSCRSIIT